jgi:hypothetical protein
MKRSKIALVLLFVLGWIGSAGADYIFNTPIVDTFTIGPLSGTSYGTYRNSGDLLFVESGNNFGSPTRMSYVQSLVRDAVQNQSLELFITNNVTYTPFDSGRTGTWTTTPPVDAISFYVVKAGNAFAMYQLVDDDGIPAPDGSGSWSTFDLYMAGYGGKGGIEISHFTGYNPTPSTSVPEPATMLLFGAGAIVFGGYVRRKRITN